MSHDPLSLSPAERDRLAQELLELHFGCHEDPEALEARLAAEPRLRELQEEVLAQARALERAVRPEQPPLRLVAPRRVHPLWQRLRSPVWRLAAAVAAAAAVVLGMFVVERVAHFRHTSFQTDHLHLTVSAPRAVPAGAPWTFTVQGKDLRGDAMDCKVRWESFDDTGARLGAGEVGTQAGQATVAMTADLRVPARVVVTAKSATDEVTQTLPLSAAAAGPLVHVTTDRPVYRPGEPVFVRAVVLDRVTRLPLPVQQPMIAQLLDARDAPVANDHEQMAPTGVGSFRLQLPADSGGGPHTVRVQSQTGAFPAETASIVVRAFHAPQLEKKVVLDRASYAPGARGSATVTVHRLAAGGAAASGASASASLVVDGTVAWTGKQAIGPDGAATFAFVVPKIVAQGAARFVATIDDGGIVETEVRPFVVPTGKILVAAFPEGGELVAGVECGLYLELADPLGRPVDASGELLEDGRSIARFRTAHQGRAKLVLAPRANAAYTVRVAGHGEPFPLPAVQPHGIALRLRGDDVAAGEPLRVTLAGRGDGPWLLGVFCRGVMVGQTTLRPDADGALRADAEVPLPPHATGVLRATVFDRALQPIAERLVRRHAAHRLDVALQAQRDTLSPGDAQQITVRTTDETGAARAAVVGVHVADLGVHSLGSEPHVGLVDHAMLFADVERTENLGDFFLAAKESGRNVDLLLGTRGWRRFVWRNDAAAQATIAARGKQAEGMLAREGFSHTPQVASNLGAAAAPAHGLARAASRAERVLRDSAGIALLVLGFVLFLEGVAWLLRRSPAPVSWPRTVFTLAGSTVVLLAVVSLLVPQQLGSALAPGAAARPGVDAEDFAAPGGLGVTELGERRPIAAAAPVQVLLDDFIANALVPAGGRADRWGELVVQDMRRAGMDPAGNPLAAAFYADGVDGARQAPFHRALLGQHYVDDLADVLGRPRIDAYRIQPDAGGWDDRLYGWSFHQEGTNEAWFKQAYMTHVRTRQYAHQHVANDARDDFAPTICWQTLVATNERGEATVPFATTDAVTTWRVHADAHAPTGTGRLGQATLDFATRLPLQVECKLPAEVSAGDRLELPISAVVTDPALTEVTLSVAAANGLRVVDTALTKITLQQGRGRALVPLTVDTTVGVGTLHVAATAGRFVDRIDQRITIAPRGFPHRRSLGGSVEAGKPSSGTLAIPAASVAGSGRVTLKVFPSPLAALTEGLEGILREPHGCFEQASSSNYPNTLVLNLLAASGDDVPVVAARARALLPAGYTKITSYECKQQGYEWFGADPGHEALTAYGLLQFHDMRKVHDVDAAMVDRTRAWLLGRRDGKGGFGRNARALDRFGGASEHLTNAYCTYALLLSGTPATDLATELDALARRTTSEDPYELALIACAFHLAGRPEAPALRATLAKLQRPDGSLHGTTTSITKSGGTDLVVETTGFAVLAWLPDPAHTAAVRSAIEFVQGKRSACGTFGATQATIVALRAITAYATVSRSMRAPGTLRVFAGDRKLAERAFTAQETNALTFELWGDLAPGEHTLRLEVEGGGGPLPWACDVGYHAEQPADDPAAPIAVQARLRADRAIEGDTVALDVTVTNRTEHEQPTPIAIVGLPAGCELPTRVLEDLQEANAFASWELRGRELVLYWRSLAAKSEQRLTLDLVAHVPGTTSGPASRGYVYYTPSAKHWAAPVVITIAPR